MTEIEKINCSTRLLNDMKSVISSHNPIKDINLFSILGMETKEVSAHSAFLFYVFEPFIDSVGDNNCDNLKALYDYLKTIKNELPDNPENLYIYREVPCEYGRMDFLIRYNIGCKADAIVIELKIKAGEQEDQINRYRKFLKENDYTEDNIFFLTPDGRRDSTTGDAFAVSLEDMCFKRSFKSMER